MKTIYLIGWILNAILVFVYGPNFKQVGVLYIFNMIIPAVLLFVRMLIVHLEIDESKIPL